MLTRLAAPKAAPPADVRREGGVGVGTIAIYAVVHLLALGAIWTGVALEDFIAAFLLVFVRGLCVSAGYHRLLAHHSFKTSRVGQFLLAAGACSALRGGPLWWTALHRHHHQHADTEVDLHPRATGFWYAYAGWLVSGRYTTTDYALVRDLARLPELRWLNRLWLAPAAVIAVSCYLVGGMGSLVVAFGWSAVALLHVLCLVDALDHRLGDRRYATPDDSRNSMTLSLLALGEGWHNNHHHCPWSCRQGFYWWESDTTYLVLVAASWVGLTWDLRTPKPDVLERNRIAAAPPKDGSAVSPREVGSQVTV
jgi:stearoyl-CoA desaturase (delta-9 desaturase)